MHPARRQDVGGTAIRVLATLQRRLAMSLVVPATVARRRATHLGRKCTKHKSTEIPPHHEMRTLWWAKHVQYRLNTERLHLLVKRCSTDIINEPGRLRYSFVVNSIGQDQRDCTKQNAARNTCKIHNGGRTDTDAHAGCKNPGTNRIVIIYFNTFCNNAAGAIKLEIRDNVPISKQHHNTKFGRH